MYPKAVCRFVQDRADYCRISDSYEKDDVFDFKMQRACDELGITLAEVCFVGDDINDIDLLSHVGYPCCPPNARPEVRAVNGIRILNTPGGQGAIREASDRILSTEERII